MNKEIEEMQKVICEHCSYENIENYPCKKERNKCAGYQIAELFYNAGYRKIEKVNGHNLPHEIDYLLTGFDENDISELLKEYEIKR